MRTNCLRHAAATSELDEEASLTRASQLAERQAGRWDGRTGIGAQAASAAAAAEASGSMSNRRGVGLVPRLRGCREVPAPARRPP